MKISAQELTKLVAAVLQHAGAHVVINMLPISVMVV
jgi:hypothetical protein